MHRLLLLCLLIIPSFQIYSQTNVRAWYADGQVWIVWNIQLPITETVGIYASDEPFTNTSEARLIGRPFILDYLPSALKEQVDTTATYRIPDGNGGKYQLEPTEGLFVYTPHEAGSEYFAVVRWGQSDVFAGAITDESIAYAYDPVNDPVECHLQATFISPFSAQHRCFAYYMWVDGRDNENDARPDFPVMANFAKNGMTGFFFVSMKLGLDTTKPFPMAVWLHGGGGIAQQSLPGSKKIVNIDPEEGILVAHNDDVYGHRGSTIPFIDNPSLHFGWRKHWDPFTTDNIPTEVDTIINYTQRKYLWIDEWLIRTFNVDRNRVHIQGHSMGSWGATGLIKAFPEHYSSAVIFNNGFRGPDPGENIAAMFGDVGENFPTNIIDRNGNNVRYPAIFDLNTNASHERDIPFLRSFHSKNDVGNANYWGPEVVENYIAADALGHGVALYWSERGHGIDTGPDFDDHWVNGPSPDVQTAVDNITWAESHYRADQSYPAFYNHRLDPNALNPGDGTPGTGPFGVGDDWGTWGGWHRWDVSTIVDETNTWSVDAWLEANAPFDHDNSPFNQLTADLSIRKPQNFKPAEGTFIHWEVVDIATQELFYSGTTQVGEDDLVSIPIVVVFKEDIRKVRITISTDPLGTDEDYSDSNNLRLYPNPVTTDLVVALYHEVMGNCEINIFSSDAKLIHRESVHLDAGDNEIKLQLPQDLAPGNYVIEVKAARFHHSEKFIKK